ncbi:uncharacterized protein PHACADRAFT_249098 [Phanerochaete carnosa HHB-10118-sp]|uniref:AAA+ ATPase domain-containing protein n=1 Tax=Phanerochaete carnosa (strain HHB-10118-sp) TaxID=650164 RepID=K5V853_PHACS|nr:uncharacterized protein PHACADRAFT_249098 [Phanerochaete carnosa HHB-10118-sp]EKM58961.1 hypothetical protein PHACADRAFT_249098 [Phanerochaete carnosa HHB-10118-sp]
MNPSDKLLIPNYSQQGLFNFNFPSPSPAPDHNQSLVLKLPTMPNTRSSARQRTNSNASGSEYHASNASMDVDDLGVPEEEEEEEKPMKKVVLTTSSRGRKLVARYYKESSDAEDLEEDGDGDELNLIDGPHANDNDEREDGPIRAEDDDDDDDAPRYQLRTRKKRNSFIASSDDDDAARGGRLLRSHSKPSGLQTNGTSGGRASSSKRKQQKRRPPRTSSRRTRANSRQDEQDGNYEDEGSASTSGGSAAGSLVEEDPEDALGLGAAEDADADAEGEPEVEEQENDGKPYSFRQRAKVNYAIPPPIEEMRAPPPKPRGGGRSNGRPFGRAKAPGWSATGAELSRWIGGGDDSDSDFPTRTPRKNLGMGGAGGGLFAGSAGTGGLLPGDLAAAAGTPSNFGKVGDAALADADPLGVSQNVTFDEVGGLDDHINALKEMTLLPLLYPEVFQRFNVTPPRGVLFHGPPGTGKTLLARALAASCRSNGKGISFFMRKGADCLSKWVGEAERQLRLLFEEARNSQPSIIFFDEIDGLAPVRSSKQDQIHASIVSTLLALMDGMDGRGQVVVIGATNRPDAIDPALRRPGRFDREFYFPLPPLDARERILKIMTRKWEGWEGEKGEENAKGLAKLTRGYGGADIRALCTEAALNAVQRRYPQIYKSTDRLILKPETISVELRDFMISIKKLVPSSARATAPTASPLPEQLAPLLQSALDRIKSVINDVLPVGKKRTALEEAEYEDEESPESALERELMLQSMETLRVYRPRVVLYGPVGMGQAYVAAAALHHLEGYHAQSLDLGNLLSDSTRTTEAAIVQLFVEAKRHQPSVVYIPSLSSWCAAVSETARTTVRSMLDSLAPTDPVLLLAVVDGPFAALPRDVKAWFGPTRDNRVALAKPSVEQRTGFFEKLVKDVTRPPNHFPDGMKRKKRVLEELPIAPPLEPRQPTAAELAMQQEADQRTQTLLRYRLGPILTELKRKFKRFTKRASEEYGVDFEQQRRQQDAVSVPAHQVETITTTVEVRRSPNGDTVEVVNEEQRVEQVIDVDQPMPPAEAPVDAGVSETVAQEQIQIQPQLFDVDLERMHLDLYRDRYLTPEDFLDDVRKIVHNANARANEDPDRLFRAQAMLTAAEVSIQDFDTNFRLECQRMATRELKRRDEYRRNKAKEKADEEAQNAQNQPTRRSARHTGQQPELAITDPLKLERRLKRARSAGASAEPSEEEPGDEAHAAKRSRVSSAEADGQAVAVGLDGLSPSRSLAVRFVDDTSQMAGPSTPTRHANGAPLEYPPDGQGEDVLSESPRKPSGFDPSLLNPMSPDAEDKAYLMSTPTRSISELPTQLSPVCAPSATPSVPTPMPNGVGDAAELPSQSITHEVPSIVETGMVVDDVPRTPVPEPQPEPMVVARTPTPLPDFVVDGDEVAQLKADLCNKTEPLNVEELEQLRAACLALVWKHRSEWDRSALIREMRQAVDRFVDEVNLDDMDSSYEG